MPRRPPPRWTRFFTWAAAIIGTFPFLWLVLARIDVRLHPKLAACEQPGSQNFPPEENAYYALVGFYTEDPQADINRVGQSMLAEYLRRVHEDPNMEDYKYPQERPVLGKPSSLCDPLRARCLQDGAASAQQLEQLEQQNDVLLERYHSLYRYSGYRDTAPAHTSHPWLNSMTSMHYLVLARIALEATRGKQTDALQRLARDTEFWRMMLREADYLVDKAVATRFVLENARVLSGLLASTATPSAQDGALIERMLRPLSNAERDLEPSMEHEACIFGGGLPAAFQNGWNESRRGPPIRIARHIMFAFITTALRPNDTKNLVREQLIESRGRAHSRTRHFGDSLWDYIYNPLGKYLVYTYTPDDAQFSRYRDRLNDLDTFLVTLAQGVTR